MKKRLLFLVPLMSLIAWDVRAESSTEKTDIFTEMSRSYGSPKEQDQEADKIKHMEDVPALEWMQMSIGEKQDHILASAYVLGQHGVPLRKSPNYYYDLVQEKLNGHPDLYNTYLTDVLSMAAYEKEPGTREVLDKLRKKS